MSRILVVIVATCPLWSEDRTVFSMEKVTAGMVSLHLEMTRAEVEGVVGPPYWKNGELAGVGGKDVASWQISPKEEEKPADGKSALKFLVVRFRNDKVELIQTVTIIGMIGVNR
jgi:hypothetical protein